MVNGEGVDGVDKIDVGDTITVTGYIKRYNDATVEFDSGCTLDSYTKAATPTATVSVDTDLVYIGESIVVTVTMSDLTEVAAMSVEPVYDPTVFRLDSGEWKLEGALLSDFNLTNGCGVIKLADKADVNKAIFTFTLAALATAENAEIGCTVKYEDPDNLEIIAITAAPAVVNVVEPEEPHVHTYGEWTVSVDPTLESTGLLTRVCSGDETHTETFVLPALSESDYDCSTTPATCVAAGSATYVFTKDGQTFEFTVEIPATGAHTLVMTAAVEASCEEGGNDEYYTCSVCGKLFSDAEGKLEIEGISETPVLGHDLVLVDRANPTCTEKGREAYYHCDRCGKNFEDAEGAAEITDLTTLDIDMIDHTYGDAVGNGNRTHTYTCGECQDSYTEDCDDQDADGRCDICGDTIYVIGDYNNDGVITSDDAIYMLYQINDEEGLVVIYQPTRDFNGDGVIDDKDALYLLYHVFFKDMYELNP